VKSQRSAPVRETADGGEDGEPDKSASGKASGASKKRAEASNQTAAAEAVTRFLIDMVDTGVTRGWTTLTPTVSQRVGVLAMPDSAALVNKLLVKLEDTLEEEILTPEYRTHIKAVGKESPADVAVRRGKHDRDPYDALSKSDSKPRSGATSPVIPGGLRLFIQAEAADAAGDDDE
jgi:RecA-family ATPase